MATPELYPCFGLEILGMCKYDPRAPSPSYFTIGDAVAALAFTLAVQQFLKPIYRFRIRALGIRLTYVVAAVFVGAFCTVIAAAAPSLAFAHGTIWGHPLFWEIAGGLVIGAAYAIVAALSLRPAVVSNRNIRSFVRSGAELLSEATDEDRLSLAHDILTGENFVKLIDIASEYERANAHALMIEFERRKELGLEMSIMGQPPVSAFYIFSRRTQLDLAADARYFLDLLSDQDFCRVVATRHSWNFLRAVAQAADRNVTVDAARTFVQTVTWQSILQEDSMLSREDGFEGFAISRSFADSFFGNSKIAESFAPFDGLWTISARPLNNSVVSRLNLASKILLNAIIEDRGFWSTNSIQGIVNIYSNASRNASFERSKNKNFEWSYTLGRGLSDLSQVIQGQLDSADPRIHDLLFAETLGGWRNDAIDSVAQIVFEGIESISNDFTGFDDPAWSFAHMLLDDIFPQFKTTHDGLSPFQQAILIKLIDKLKQNMRGFYPTVSCVLIAFVGPFKSNAPPKQGTAFAILRDAVYWELKQLPNLFDKKGLEIADRLPSNVTYDPTERSLTHTYRGGQQVITVLDELPIGAVDLLAEVNLRRRGGPRVR